MKFSMTKKIAAIVMASTVAAGSAQAFIFAAPILGVVIAGGIVAGVHAGKKAANEGKVDQTLATRNQEKLNAVVQKIDNTDYALRMTKYSRYSNGYYDVISRYDHGRIEGSLSLESLAEAAPKLFADLDILEQLMTEAYGQEVTTAVYGAKLNADGSVNWLRYKLLSQDALAINAGSY
ncbi:hypothetical protein [Bdellovibrio sp. HCB337]|uniref:hypothetical protein n=1 Tax=Bdellovibrio sp. HCB337 TaxID=3394358 RepID=UPI0039A5BB72